MNVSKAELLEFYSVNEDGIIISHVDEGVRNAFVGQPLYVAWYWSDYEPVSGGEGDEDENGDITLKFEITNEDANEFPELSGRVGETIAIKREVRVNFSEIKEGEL